MRGVAPHDLCTTTRADGAGLLIAVPPGLKAQFQNSRRPGVVRRKARLRNIKKLACGPPSAVSSSPNFPSFRGMRSAESRRKLLTLYRSRSVSDLIVAEFDDAHTAFLARAALARLQRELPLPGHDVAVVTRASWAVARVTWK